MHDRFYSFEEKARNRRLLYWILAALFVAVIALELMHGVAQ